MTHLIVSMVLRVVSFMIVPFAASRIIADLEVQDYDHVYLSIALFVLSALIYILCHHYNFWSYYITANDLHNNLQKKVLKKITEFDTGFTANISRATLISTAYQDIDLARQVPDFFCDFFGHILGIITAVVVLCVIDLKIGLIVAGLLVISILVFIHHTKKRDHYRTIMREHADEMTGLYTQIIDGYKEVQTLNLKENLAEYLEKEKNDWKKYHYLQRKHRDFAAGAVPMIIGIGRICIYLICADLILKGQYTVATLVLVVGYYEDILSRYDKMCECLDNVSRSSLAVERLHRLLHYQTSHMLKFGDNNTDDIKGEVEFKNVSFRYEEPPKKTPDGTPLKVPLKKAPSFKDISFKIPSNSWTAIVGKSGSGKSTIFRLLLRLYKVNSGKILLDGEDICDYTKEVYASNVSIVTQRPFVFDMTIRENLSLVDSNKENQINACKLAGIHEDIMKLEKGYDTLLIQDASNLSAGQKQLLSLARTLLSKSEVLLFDEVTSSLDANSTEKVVKVLEKLKENHTVIMITHKPELMRLADNIIMVGGGHVIAEGPHKKLIKSCKEYKTLQK